MNNPYSGVELFSTPENNNTGVSGNLDNFSSFLRRHEIAGELGNSRRTAASNNGFENSNNNTSLRATVHELIDRMTKIEKEVARLKKPVSKRMKKVAITKKKRGKKQSKSRTSKSSDESNG